MWKPGTAKPNNSTPKHEANAPGPGVGGGSNGSSSVKKPSTTAKKLSTSTMGMRFMQRNNDSKQKEQEERKLCLQAAAARQNNRNRNHTTANASDSHEGVAVKRERPKEEQSATSEGAIILELASSVDMYGVGSDIVGRRSFGGFHKAIRTTWEAALKRRTDEDASARNTKNHITDQELLDRYEKYVQGGRRAEGEGAGNKGRKGKRKHDG